MISTIITWWPQKFLHTPLSGTLRKSASNRAPHLLSRALSMNLREHCLWQTFSMGKKFLEVVSQIYWAETNLQRFFGIFHCLWQWKWSVQKYTELWRLSTKPHLHRLLNRERRMLASEKLLTFLVNAISTTFCMKPIIFNTFPQKPSSLI